MSNPGSSRRRIGIAIAFIVVASMVQCTRHYLGKAQVATDAYAQACHGRPLGGPAERNQAMEDGYEINLVHDCISRQSYEEREAALAERGPTLVSPGAQARTAATMARPEVLGADAGAAELSADKSKAGMVRQVDANTGNRTELTDVSGLDSALVEQILDKRSAGAFANWDDMIKRVDGLRVANRAALVSAGGLRVNGQSYAGTPAEAAVPAPAPAPAINATLKKEP